MGHCPPYMRPRRITQCNTEGDMHLIVYVLFVFFVMHHNSPRPGKVPPHIGAMPGYFAWVGHQVSNNNLVWYCNITHNE